MLDEKIWKKCVEFHGHECPGLAIGYRVALYAQELLDVDFSLDEEIVCVVENDSCSVDAIQVITGCTAGKGNLIFHVIGKHAYSFYDRNTGKSLRILLKKINPMEKDELFEYIHNMDVEDLFEVKSTAIELPKRAKIFNSITCSNCGEETAEGFIKYFDDKPFCMDCFNLIH